MKRAASLKDRNKLFSVDALMKNISLMLVRDFQTTFEDPLFAGDLHTILRSGDTRGIREWNPTIDDQTDIPHFKALYQLQSLSKRHRYQDDIYSDSELEEISIQKFLDTQNRLANIDLNSLSASDNRILDLAAGYISEVLGEYSDEEHRALCRFGKGASVGVPARAACLAARWELPLSGSQNQINWFDSEMSRIEQIQNYWDAQKSREGVNAPSTYQLCDSLKLVLVPKTFKSLRVIMPNTTIGSYMSYGLGEMIRKRLKRAGYDIKTLQQRHKYYAQQGSVHGLWTTADLSSASDSITVALVERLFPQDWVDILHQSRIANVQLTDGSIIQSLTFCTMGIGYTFPLQTLVFLALLKAVEHVHYGRLNRRLISVYGDDMVYASRMHTQVVDLFSKIGFVMNFEKTFHEGYFRESCGGDYYRGVDVRPFQPRNGSAFVGSKAYEAVLYKCVNGLLARWSEYEVGTTLDYLTSEIEKTVGTCKIVPSDFPDDSGIKCSYPAVHDFLNRSKIASPKRVGHGLYRFSYLRFITDMKKETRHEPYLWDFLRDAPPIMFYNSQDRHRKVWTDQARIINRAVGIREHEPLLSWREVKPTLTFRSKLTGRRLRRLEACVVISHTGSYKRQSGISCFEKP